MTNPIIRPRFLLTGAAGALGSAIRARATDQFDWVCLDLKTGGDDSIREGSCSDAALLDELLPGCDGVIHTAALHGHNRRTHTPTQYTEVNVGGLVTLLEACLRHNVGRCVFSSTMEVLIGQDWTAAGMAVVDERSTPHPDWIYPVSKLLCEQVGEYYYDRHSLEFVALRFMDFSKSKPSPGLLARALMSEDVAAANLLAAVKPNLGCEVLNIGPETPLTASDIVQAATDPSAVIEKYWPGAVGILQSQGVKLHSSHFWPVTRIERAKRVLGWRPKITFETYLCSLGWSRGEA